MVKTKKLGKHTIVFEEPDILFLTMNGDFFSEDIVALYAELDILREHLGRSPMVLADAQHMGSMSSEARKTSIDEMKKSNKRQENFYIAVYGASFQIRVLINLLTNAVSLFTRQPNNTKFFKAEKEARTWLQELRDNVSNR